MRLLLLLVIPLAVWSQPLPLAWPDKPEGSVGAITGPVQYGGAHAFTGNGGFLFAWADARDGQARLLACKRDLADLSQPGPWASDLPGPGPLDVLAYPAGSNAVLPPAMVPDGQGGAFLLWQRATSVYQADLLLQRIGDGSTGQGSMWPEPLRLTQDASLPYDGCRDAARCRGWLDALRGLRADGQGGVWVFWVNMAGQTMLQHIEADGALDPDLPAEGLLIITEYRSSKLACDAQGAALLVHSRYESPLQVRGVGLDGQPLLPELDVSLSLPGADVDDFVVETVQEGTLVAWLEGLPSGDKQVRAQLLDDGLAPLWGDGGMVVEEACGGSLRLASTSGAAPYYISYSDFGQILGRKLDAAGHLLWPQPVSLQLYDEPYRENLLTFSADSQGLLAVILRDGGVHMRRLDGQGAPLWPVEITRVSSATDNVDVLWLHNEAPGSWNLGLSESLGQQVRERVVRRAADGSSPLSEEASVYLRRDPRSMQGMAVASSATALYSLWTVEDSLFVSMTDLASGDPLPAPRRQYLGHHTGYQGPAPLAVADGLWVLGAGMTDIGLTVPTLRKFLPEGGSGLEETELLPGIEDQPNYWGVSQLQLAGSTELAYAAMSTGTRLYIQAMTSQGGRPWGEQGRVLGDTDNTCNLVGMCGNADGGVDVAWFGRLNAVAGYYFQHFAPDGTPRYADNQGRGRLIDVPCQPGTNQLVFLAAPDGSRLFGTRNGDRIDLLWIDSQGVTPWRRTLITPGCEEIRVWLDSQGSPMLHRRQWINEGYVLLVDRLGPGGASVGSWSLPMDPLRQVHDINWIQGAPSDLLMTIVRRGGGTEGLCAQGWSLTEGEPAPRLVFDAPLTTEPVSSWPLPMQQGPGGDVLLAWSDFRSGLFGYGFQLRVQRLDVLEENTGVEPVQPAAFRLEPNVPNPFNPSTEIRFHLAQAGPVRLEVFNLAGQRVRLLADEVLGAGAHRVGFDGRGDEGAELGSGLYFCRLSSRDGMATRRMLLVR